MTRDDSRKTQIRARMAETGEKYTEAARALDAEQAGTAPGLQIITIEPTHPQGFGGHEFEYDPGSDVFRCANCRGYEIALRDPETGQIPRCAALPRLGAATVTLDGVRWRIHTPDGSYPETRTGMVSWRKGVPVNDRACFLASVGSELDAYGWNINGPDLPDPVPDTVDLELIRNTRGLNLDEAQRLHDEAGVTWFHAHDAYIHAVAATVAGTGVPVSDICADANQPRDGWFTVGEPAEDDEDDEDGPLSADVIAWREDRGWYHVHYSDRNAAAGDYVSDLPGLTQLTPPPHEVAFAVLEAFTFATQPVAPTIWEGPDGYDPDPAPADDDGFSVSAALERSLLAYVKR